MSDELDRLIELHGPDDHAVLLCVIKEQEERIAALAAENVDFDTANTEYREELKQCNSRIAALEKSPWIPVSERLPEKTGDYFCRLTDLHCGDSPYGCIVFHKDLWHVYGVKVAVTHWMEIPA